MTVKYGSILLNTVKYGSILSSGPCSILFSGPWVQASGGEREGKHEREG